MSDLRLDVNPVGNNSATDNPFPATEFLRGMNLSMDPCEDFYEFSCGGWVTNVTIPGSSMFWNRDTLYQDIVYYRLKGKWTDLICSPLILRTTEKSHNCY